MIWCGTCEGRSSSGSGLIIHHIEKYHQGDLPTGTKENFTPAMKRSLPKANIEKSKPLVLVASDKAQNGTRAIHTTSLPEHTVCHFLVFLDSYLFFFTC